MDIDTVGMAYAAGGFVALVVELVGLVLALVFRRRLGTAAATCAALGFGLMIVQYLATILVSWLASSSAIEQMLIINQIHLIALPLVAAAVFLGRRAPTPPAQPYAPQYTQPYTPPYPDGPQQQ